ncbi:hypothetical protein EXIGLDRAFT_791012 [Exidia glandulosa HHB12029]|uniref:Uncharacterized protein n=1 Tax=Exidia glandulosa HHB12029 TaxID=1314781 RepID=A0A165HNB9_EXIGL|nr:hypothetical protein EXIGLDRAFT_791012 [Exidia glandulosa HHB12029]
MSVDYQVLPPDWSQSIVVASSTSLIATGFVLVLVGVRCARNLRSQQNVPRGVFNTHLDIYVFFLILSDMMQALASILSIQWLRQGRTTCGDVCYAQGSLKVISDAGPSMYSLAIAVHTFMVIVCRWEPRSSRIPAIVVCLTWTYRLVFYAAIAGAAEPGEPLFRPTPFWCWISAHYAQERIPAFYFWLWSCTGLSIVLYVPLFLYIRGNLEVDSSRIWRVSLRRAPQPIERFGTNFRLADQSRKMLMYPVVYVVLSVPFSVMRWAASFRATHAVPAPWYFLCISLHYYEGLANVLLLILTRPSILGFSRTMPHRGEIVDDPSRPRVAREIQAIESVESSATQETM